MTVTMAMASSERIKNAEMRMANPYPTFLMRRFIIMGKITPPREEPVLVEKCTDDWPL